MPTFDTPQPVTVTVELSVGHVRIAAADRADTVLEVEPSDPAKKTDVALAAQTSVDYADGRLTIRAPKGRRHPLRSDPGSIDVRIDLPSGSGLRGHAGIGSLQATGRLGECSYRLGAGDVRIDGAGPVELRTGVGTVSVGRASGPTIVTTGTGAVRIDAVDASAVVKNSNGDTRIGEVGGDVRVASANGSISVGRARGTVVAKTARGDVRLGEVARGEVRAETAYGQVEVGIRPGVAAWLDLDTRFGKVHNDLEAAGEPGPGEETVEVRARTSFGDVTVRRAPSREASPADV